MTTYKKLYEKSREYIGINEFLPMLRGLPLLEENDKWYPIFNKAACTLINDTKLLVNSDDDAMVNLLESFNDYCSTRLSYPSFIRYYLLKIIEKSGKKTKTNPFVFEQYITIICYLVDCEYIDNKSVFFDNFKDDYQMETDATAKLRLKELADSSILVSKRISVFSKEKNRRVAAGIEYRLNTDCCQGD